MATRDNTLALVVNGTRFAGWTDIRITRGVEQASAAFSIGCTQKWPGQDTRFGIAEGASCEAWIGNDKVLTGYVDVIAIERSPDDASCTISGRSKTCDLVDCSPDYATVEQANLTLLQVASGIAAPFGITVIAPQGTGPAIPIADSHHGETAWKTIERLARQQKLLVMDDEQGRLVLAPLATTKADDTLVYPSDGLEKLSTKRDMSKRFSVYTVKGQAGRRWLGIGSATGPSSDTVPTTLAHAEGVYYDLGVPRYRPKTIANEGAAKKEGVMARAEWEARRNIGKALRITATRVGWRQSSGALWKSNLLVPVQVPQANVDETLAIASVTYIKNNSAGTICELELVPPDALTPEPPAATGGTTAAGQWSSMGGALSSTAS